ncbi:MNN10 [Symbiodinium natans]|uniref:MNN10 protein n=1 Tax=Symbiodinium natans TaxID=878477 RepID=A0A812TC63_9DINO|nr:MNN10 [Symbiodinium natans]
MVLLPLALALLPAAAQSPYEGVVVPLLEEECLIATKDPATLAAWREPTVASLEARAHLAGSFGVESRAAALGHWLTALLQLFDSHLDAAFQCPALAAQHLQSTAEWSLSLDHPRRARILIQLGNAFKFQALKEFASLYHEIKDTLGPPTDASLEAMPNAPPKRFLPRLHIQYQIMLGQLHDALRVQPLPWMRGSAFGRVEIHSICSYKPDPTSKTTLESPLLGLSVPNHQAYAQRHGYRYVVHTESALPDREAHYSKMYVVYQRMTGQRAHWAFQANQPEDAAPDWVFFVDCDAFFTDFTTSISDLINTYAQPSPGNSDFAHFLVAEDPGGINTGVFLLRNSAWSLRFLERVASSTFTVAWDQSMFFWQMVRGALEMGLEDFSYPPEVRLVHQAHFNAFVPPASVDWMAHEWRPSNFVRHFAGCPWQEQPCLQMMVETAEMAALPQTQQEELWKRSSTASVR